MLAPKPSCNVSSISPCHLGCPRMEPILLQYFYDVLLLELGLLLKQLNELKNIKNINFVLHVLL